MTIQPAEEPRCRFGAFVSELLSESLRDILEGTHYKPRVVTTLKETAGFIELDRDEGSGHTEGRMPIAVFMVDKDCHDETDLSGKYSVSPLTAPITDERRRIYQAAVSRVEDILLCQDFYRQS